MRDVRATQGELGVVRILPPQQGFRVFDKGDQQNQSRTEKAHHKHSFEDAYQEHA
jgi:hypothetical protein